MAQIGQGMEPIKITTVSETEYSRTPERGGGYLEITKRVGVDQHGKQWHSFHNRIVLDLSPKSDEGLSAAEQTVSES